MGTDKKSLLLLLNWMSPSFPTGSFAYSHGVEQAISDGRLTDAASVENWISDLLTRGSGWNDAVLFARCWDNEPAKLNALALSLAGSAERHLEMTQLGKRFHIAASVWTEEQVDDDDIAYPVAAGRACVGLGIAQDDALLGYLQGFCAVLVSVAVRLVPLGQTAGLRVLRNLSATIAQTAERAAHAPLDEIGGCCVAADIAAMKHETLEPRIFRT